jgi:hypothetical protein
MLPDELFTNSHEFLRVVMTLRSWPPCYRSLALYASDHWSNEELIERAGRVPVDDEVRGRIQ